MSSEAEKLAEMIDRGESKGLAAQIQATFLELLRSDEGKAVVREVARKEVDKERQPMTGERRMFSQEESEASHDTGRA